MRPLSSNIELYTAKLDRTAIVIFIGAELVGSGVIEDISEFNVEVKGERLKLSRKAQVAQKQGRLLAECRNYQKQRMVVAKLHEKIANQRNDLHHKRSTDLVNNHDVIFVESLNIQGMVRRRGWGRSLHDVSWFLSKLTYKAAWYGKQVIPIGRWFPSSQICSVCGHQDGKKELHIREWSCPSCGVHHDRDINASMNIRADGLRQTSLFASV
ncbi:RNA-guided endonuclease TnpB family protein [Paenibacillus xylanexedens]|uniref:RNA-guided endonuclease TnpB family protein n=1 Tax=Paenibacillus xylanexedens TaxID=528191 RepID=UPI00119C9859|nr:RNA-guided endonuclease TnpB family protein [Paenibacillus xylanexedens]